MPQHSTLEKFSMDFFSLKNQCAIVTDGNHGLGRTFALALAQAGANIFVPTQFDDRDHTAELVTKEKVQYQDMQIDLNAPYAARQVADACIDHYGRIDILINCGTLSQDHTTEFNRERWHHTLSKHMGNVFELSHEVTRYMIPQRSGKIINICSTPQELHNRNCPALAATRHGLAGFTQAYCKELAPYNIQVNCVLQNHDNQSSDNNAESDITEKKIFDALTNTLNWQRDKYQQPRPHTTAKDVTGCTIFLASQASNYVSGQILVLDGGWTQHNTHAPTLRKDWQAG